MPTDLVFNTNSGTSISTEKLRITSGGQVLINDTSLGNHRSDAPLQIETGSSGNCLNLRTRSSDDVYSYINFQNNAATQTAAEIYLARNTSTNAGNLSFGTANPNSSTPQKRMMISSGGATTLHVNSASHETFRFTTQGVNEAKLMMKDAGNNVDIQLNTAGDSWFNGGDVGIGTNIPTGNFEVSGNDGINISNATRTGTNGAQWRLIPHSGGSNAGAATNLRLYEGVGVTEVINITKTGLVGINTNNPLRKLHVEGEIISRSFANATGQRGNMIMSSISQGSYDTLGVRIGTIVETAGANGYGMEFYTQQSYLTGQTLKMTIAGTGTVTIPGALNVSGTKNFKIPHPHPSKKDTHDLVHSVIEGPQCDNIYRGKVNLVDGTASINIDTVSNMTDGTFVALNRDIQCFTSNETGWTAVKGSVSGNILTITAQDNTCTDTISWMVVGERQDPTIKEMPTTDDDGKLIVEPIKETIEVETEEVVVPADRFA
jgi:hypothetical protein